MQTTMVRNTVIINVVCFGRAIAAYHSDFLQFLSLFIPLFTRLVLREQFLVELCKVLTLGLEEPVSPLLYTTINMLF